MRASVRTWWREGESWYVAAGLANLVIGASSILIPLSLKALLSRSVDSLGILSSLVSGYLARWAGYEAAFGAAAVFLALAIVVFAWVPEPEPVGDRSDGAAAV